MTKKSENIHQGNLEIRTAADAEKYKTLTKVTGAIWTPLIGAPA